MNPFSQESWLCRCEWGPAAATALAPADVTIVVDVLSFTTCVDVATSRGAFILPFRWGDWMDPALTEFARTRNAEAAGKRKQARYTLAPDTYLDAPAGPPAAGKMTVGLELERLTGLRLFHNHMSVDIALRFLPFGSPGFRRIVGDIRRGVFEEVAASDLPGLIFTYVWALNDPTDRAAVDNLTLIFSKQGAIVNYVELAATQEERLRRNQTPLRLAEKEPKRNLARSRELLLEADQKHQLNSNADFFYPDAHVRIDNTALAPELVARQIIKAFGIPLTGASR